ncbi:hypothetical protein ElyMa_001782200 [Elysia marginata]|uniref:Uncharacterized protein n=1 Tax=Elysia marginata TaxID=1093978 RepID=A0AAV4EE98_9GAST|nr:hypothetical protein ElyMa_001782200 [Elysia marginata]
MPQHRVKWFAPPMDATTPCFMIAPPMDATTPCLVVCSSNGFHNTVFYDCTSNGCHNTVFSDCSSNGCHNTVFSGLLLQWMLQQPSTFLGLDFCGRFSTSRFCVKDTFNTNKTSATFLWNSRRHFTECGMLHSRGI